MLKLALEFLVGDPDEGDTVESCTGGLLGKLAFGRAIFAYQIPILGVSGCEFVGFLQIVVDAIDQLVNDCTECEDPDAPKSTFNKLETKLGTLLQDAVGGTPKVDFTPSSDYIRSSLDMDITLHWSFLEARQLNIDLAAILEGMVLDEDIKSFVNSIVAFVGAGNVEIEGSLSLSLGVGLEYFKETKQIKPYIRGITGLSLEFAADANREFEASIGPLSATIGVAATIDNYGKPLSIKVGLNPNLNYYLSTDSKLNRRGFQRVSSIKALADQILVAIQGQVAAKIDATFFGGLGDASMSIRISDINNVIQRKPGAVSFYYKVSKIEKPSFMDLLLMDPVAMVDAVDNLFKIVNDLTLGRRGIVTTFPLPFVGTAISRALGAGDPDNFLERARRTVTGTLRDILITYDADDGESTVADLIKISLSDMLGNKLGILNGDVSLKYYEHKKNETPLIAYEKYTSDLDIKSLMWEIPFGQTYTIELPPVNFDIGNEAFPLQINAGSSAQPILSLEWSFKLAFGYDESDGFFLFTYREYDDIPDSSTDNMLKSLIWTFLLL